MDRIVTVRFLVDDEGVGRNARPISAGDVVDVQRGVARTLIRKSKAELYTPVEEIKATKPKAKKTAAKKPATKKKAVKK